MRRAHKPLNRRGRPPSLEVAARKANKLQREMRGLLHELEDLETRLSRLGRLLDASRRAEKERLKARVARNKGIRGKGPNVRDIAYQVLSRRKKPMGIQEISTQVLKVKRGRPGDNFTQNLGAALARDRRFSRVGRGLYTVKR